MGMRLATALSSRIASRSKFDRKHYFYPDLPKGYQISQFDLPLGSGGEVHVEVPEEKTTVRVGIERLHMEEDAAKNIHAGVEAGGKTLVDYNRSGVPLIELVSKPDMRSSAQAKAYLEQIRTLVRSLDISEADMEKGHMRCDANVSLRVLDDNDSVVGAELNPKTEIKNLNSFRMVERALNFEIARQTELWESNTPPLETTTRGWDDVKGKTVLQRTKEGSAEYRYFPDPDLPKMELEEFVSEVVEHLPELPAAKRARFMAEYGLGAPDAKLLVESRALSVYVEQVFSEIYDWLHSLPEYQSKSEEEKVAERNRMAKIVGTWLLNKWVGLLHERKHTVEKTPISPENFAELIVLLARGELTSANAMTVLERMTQTGKDPSHIMEEEGLGKLDDAGTLATAMSRVIEENPGEVTRYLAGEEKLLKFFMGLVMKETEGRADPGVLMNLVKVELEAKRSATQV